MKNNNLLKRLMDFSVKIILLSGKLPKTPAGFAIAGQIVRSGTSIGANCEEAQDSSSKKEFLNKITISLREAKETRYWLKLVSLTKLVVDSEIDVVIQECNEIVAILITSVRTTKERLKDEL